MSVYLIPAPPQINLPDKYSSPITIDRGQDIVLKIPFTGHPKPKAKWFKDGQELKTGETTLSVGEEVLLSSIVVFHKKAP